MTILPPSRAGSVTRTAADLLDQPARRRRADLLVGREQEDERALRGTGQRDLIEGLQREISPALHVVDAGAVEPVALDPHGQVARGGPDGMDRVEMRHDRQTGRPRGEAGPQDQGVAQPVAAGNALHRDRQAFDLGGDEIHHAVDAGRVMGGALQREPDGKGGDGIGCAHDGATLAAGGPAGKRGARQGRPALMAWRRLPALTDAAQY